MNKRPEYDQLFDEVAARLQQQTGLGLEFETPTLANDFRTLNIHAVATLLADTAQEKFVVEVKQLLTAQTHETAVRQVTHLADLTELKPLLVTRYVNAAIAQRLRQDGINYIDAAGNAHLRAGHIYVDIQGQCQPALPDLPRPLGPKGLQLAALLLAHPGYVNRTARELAVAAGVALGTVPPTLAELETRGFIGRKGPKQFVMREGNALLELWVRGYTELQRPRLLERRYRLAPGIDIRQLPEAFTKAGGCNILVGGEAAASAYTIYLRPAGATLHLMDKQVKPPAHILLPDTGGNVDVLNGFGAAEAWRGPIDGYIHPLLVYGELLAIGGLDRRMADTAQMLRKKYALGSVVSANV